MPIDIRLLQVSAKTGENLDHLFEDIAKRVLDKHLKAGGTTKSKYVLNDTYLKPDKHKIKVDEKGRFREVEELQMNNNNIAIGDEEMENKKIDKKDSCWKSC